jgi:hypothetical protein
MGPNRRHLAVLPTLACLALVACGLQLPGQAPVEAPADCGFPPGTVLSFSGVATIEEFGLEKGVENGNQPGQLYVTATDIRVSGMPPAEPPQRWFCITYPDAGVGAITQVVAPVRADWEPPR